MSRIVLVTGGVRSGKSAFAESFYAADQPVTYLATARISDAEMQARIHLHQQRRSPYWTTAEATSNLAAAVQKIGHTSVLLDCLTILTSTIMCDHTKDIPDISLPLQQTVEDAVLREITGLIEHIRNVQGTLVMVTNEVGLSIVPENHIARVYRDLLGRVNQRVAALCTEVYLVVVGIPLRLK